MSDELKDQRIPIMMTASEVAAIDDWSFSNRIRSRAEAIRRLCQFGLFYDDRADGMNSLADEIGASVKRIIEGGLDDAATAATYYEVMEAAMGLVSDLYMLKQSRNLLADGEQSISFDRIEEVREKFRSLRATRVAEYEKIITDKNAKLK